MESNATKSTTNHSNTKIFILRNLTKDRSYIFQTNGSAAKEHKVITIETKSGSLIEVNKFTYDNMRALYDNLTKEGARRV